jgi:hypothetical protein
VTICLFIPGYFCMNIKGVIVGMMRVDKNNAPLSEQGIVRGKDHEIFHCFQS